MQFTGNSGCFPRGKHAAIVRRSLAFFGLFSCVQSFRVSIPPTVRAYFFTTDGYGIFNVRTNLGAYPYTPKGRGWREGEGGGAGTEKQHVTLPARGSNPGSSDLNCDPLTTGPRRSPVRVAISASSCSGDAANRGSVCNSPAHVKEPTAAAKKCSGEKSAEILPINVTNETVRYTFRLRGYKCMLVIFVFP